MRARRGRGLVAAAVCAAALAACDGASRPDGPPPPPRSGSGDDAPMFLDVPPEGRRVPKGDPQYLQAIDLVVGGHALRAEVARTDPQRHKGLMFREDLGADEGMLFVFPESGPRSFWMRNTPLPLSIAFIDGSGRITQIEDMRPYDERNVWSKEEVPIALEVHQGWFRRKRIRAGDRVEGLERVFREPSLGPR